MVWLEASGMNEYKSECKCCTLMAVAPGDGDPVLRLKGDVVKHGSLARGLRLPFVCGFHSGPTNSHFT